MIDEKIKRHPQVWDDVFHEDNKIDYDNAIEIDFSNDSPCSIINKKGLSNLSDDLINSNYDLGSLDEYSLKIKEKKRLAKLEQERKLEEAKKIESPIDLAEVDVNMYEPMPERMVNFKRTFGVSDIRKKILNRRFTIITYIVFGITIIMLTFASLYLRFK